MSQCHTFLSERKSCSFCHIDLSPSRMQYNLFCCHVTSCPVCFFLFFLYFISTKRPRGAFTSFFRPKMKRPCPCPTLLSGTKSCSFCQIDTSHNPSRIQYNLFCSHVMSCLFFLFFLYFILTNV